MSLFHWGHGGNFNSDLRDNPNRHKQENLGLMKNYLSLMRITFHCRK